MPPKPIKKNKKGVGTDAPAHQAKSAKGLTTKDNTKDTKDDSKQEKKSVGASDDVDWTVELTWDLYNAIIENEDIRRGLFPPCGANASTAKGGGAKKSDFHYMIAEELFAQHPKYGPSFVEPVMKENRTLWARKIKNRLRRVCQQTREYTETLGETGMGIRSAEDVDLSLKNEFTNAWTKIISTFPYFLEFRDLIGERPNMKPVGLGNSSSEVDMSAILGSDAIDDSDIDEPTDDELPVPAEGDPERANNTKSKKRKASTADIASVKPEPDGAVAQQSAKPTTNKKMKPMDVLVSIGVEEEKTKQAQLAFAKTQAKADAEKVRAEIQLKETILKHKLEERRIKTENKAEQKRLKAEAKKLELELELKKIEYETELLRRGPAASVHVGTSCRAHSSPFSSHSQSPFGNDVVTPFQGSQADGFVGLGLDGALFPQLPADNM